jgi:hypothetical protein
MPPLFLSSILLSLLSLRRRSLSNPDFLASSAVSSLPWVPSASKIPLSPLAQSQPFKPSSRNAKYLTHFFAKTSVRSPPRTARKFQKKEEGDGKISLGCRLLAKLGLVCTVLALISRVLIAFNSNPPRIGVSDGIALSYNSFLHGAALFFLLAIASWCRTAKN